MQTATSDVSIQNIIDKIQVLPNDSLALVYDFILKISIESQQGQRACCKNDSLMKTSPIHLENFPFKREDFYD